MPSPKICVCFSQVIEKRYLFREGNQVGIYLFFDKVASYVLKNMVSSLSSRGDFFFKLGKALCRYRQLTFSCLLEHKRKKKLNRGNMRICKTRIQGWGDALTYVKRSFPQRVRCFCLESSIMQTLRIKVQLVIPGDLFFPDDTASDLLAVFRICRVSFYYLSFSDFSDPQRAGSIMSIRLASKHEAGLVLTFDSFCYNVTRFFLADRFRAFPIGRGLEEGHWRTSTVTELPSALEEEGNNSRVHSFLLLCRVINFSGFGKNISKCYLTLSWKIGRKQRHGMPSLCPFSVLLTTLSLFIAYVKAYEVLSNPCSKGLETRAAEKADSCLEPEGFTGLRFPHTYCWRLN